MPERPDGVILETLHGSRAYGLATSASDTDRKGIFVPRREALLGYLPAPEQVELSADHVFYDIRKFFKLAAACNPTVIELLFTAPEDRLVVTASGKLLLERRSEFLSRRAGDTFGRYGLSQLRRIKTHRRWLLRPPAGKPSRRAFGLPDRTVVERDQLGAAEALIARDAAGEHGVPANFLDVLDRERRYRGAIKEWQQYQTWLAQRNPARAQLEHEFGYDTKHAMHLIRLLRMAGEILTTGDVRVRRSDAEELLAIRRGVLSFDALLEMAEKLGGELEPLAARSALPPIPDESRLNVLCVEIVERTHAMDLRTE